MRRFEYQSPRHNQGVSYGPYRFGWDMHAAWLFYLSFMPTLFTGVDDCTQAAASAPVRPCSM